MTFPPLSDALGVAEMNFGAANAGWPVNFSASCSSLVSSVLKLDVAAATQRPAAKEKAPRAAGLECRA